MADQQVRVVISAKDEASKVFESVGNSAAGLAKTLAVGIVGAGVAVAAGLTAAISAAASFEKQMSAVGAVSGATQDEMKQLSDLALQLGKDTSFSASEAAKGLEELVKGGVTIPDIMNGAAQATLNLAAAGGVDLATAAEIASTALNTFNLSGNDMAHVSDLIAGAANASAIDVNDFRLSMASAGSVVKLVGGNFDDMTTAITAMGNAGIKGSDAGTSLKTMLLNLQPQTKQQIALFDQLGITTNGTANKFFDAQGHIKSFADVSGVLETALQGMTDQQKEATLATAFGTDGIRAAAIMADLGATGFQNLADKIGSISAADVAAQRLNNLSGDLEQLGGSAETAGIRLGQAFQEPVREATQALTKFINENVIPFIEENGPAFAEAVTNAGKSLVEGAGNFIDAAKRASQEGLQVLRDKLADTGRDLDEWARDHGKVGEAVSESLIGVSGAALALQFILQGNFKAGVKEGEDSLDHFGKAADAAKLALIEFRDEAAKLPSTTAFFQDLGKAGDDLRRTFDNLGAILPSLAGNILGVAGAAGSAGDKLDLLGGFIHALLSPLTNTTDALAKATDALVHIGDAANTIGPFFDNTRAQTQAFFDALPPAMVAGVAAFDSFRDGVAASIGEMVAGVTASLAGLAASVGAQAAGIGNAIVSGMTGAISSGISSVTTAARNLAQSALDAAKAALGAQSPSREFAILGDDIVAGLTQGIDDAASDIEASADDLGQLAIDAMIASIEQSGPDVATAGYDLGQSVTDAIAAGLGQQQTAQLAVDSLKGTVAGAMRDLAADVEQIVGDVTVKLAAIPQRAGEAVQAAIRDAGARIQDAFSEASSRIGEMFDNRALSRAIRGMRSVFDEQLAGQDEARSRQRDDEDLAHGRALDDAKFQRDLARDLGKAKTDEERAAIIERSNEQRRAIDETRRLEDDELVRRRKRADEDRQYRDQQAQKRQDFEDALGDQALQKSINRTLEDRDARVKAINDALAEKQKKISEDAAKEQAQLVSDAQKRIQTLRDEFVGKLPALTAQAQAIVNTFLGGIDVALLTVAALANNAIKAIGQIPRQVTVTVTTVQQAGRTPQPAPTSNLEPARRGPLMDEGGIVKGPSWVEVGPGVREAFIPLGSSTGVPSATINLSVYGTVVTPRDLVDAIHDGLLQKKRGFGALGLA